MPSSVLGDYMKTTRKAAAAFFAAATLTAVALPSFAQMSSDAPKARYSSATAYTGAPQLQTTLSMVIAGGGPKDFSPTEARRRPPRQKDASRSGKPHAEVWRGQRQVVPQRLQLRRDR